jgi:Meiotically up-regulated gene 113
MQARRVTGFPVWQTIKKRFGGMPQTAKALLEYGKSTGNGDLSAICEARLEAERKKRQHTKNSQPVRGTTRGVVYLKYSPSLRLYKIGIAKDSDKRGAGISLLLPEDLVPKHEIRTDCPSILEKYWHSRFREKRRQGEWFDLTASDVQTFKQRREFIFQEFFPEPHRHSKEKSPPIAE